MGWLISGQTMLILTWRRSCLFPLHVGQHHLKRLYIDKFNFDNAAHEISFWIHLKGFFKCSCKKARHQIDRFYCFLFHTNLSKLQWQILFFHSIGIESFSCLYNWKIYHLSCHLAHQGTVKIFRVIVGLSQHPTNFY